MHRDPATGELHGVVYYWEWDYVQYVVVGTDGRVRRTVDIPVPGKPMLHDCAITETQVVVLDLPVTFDLDAAMSGGTLPYGWNADYGARVGLLPRDATSGDETRWCEVDLCFVYHPLNGFDDGDRVVLDLAVHNHAFTSDDRMGGTEVSLHRWTIDPIAGKVLVDVVDDRNQDFPRADERHVRAPVERDHRHVAVGAERRLLDPAVDAIAEVGVLHRSRSGDQPVVAFAAPVRRVVPRPAREQLEAVQVRHMCQHIICDD